MSQIVCTPKYLPLAHWPAAAENAVRINPANRPQAEQLARVLPSFTPSVEFIAALTTKFWHSGKVALSVAFLDITDPPLRSKILEHMNAWSASNNIAFTEASGVGQVRIASTLGDGYWSYIGTDVLSIAPDQPTMNLDSFSLETPESEYRRVVRHETGHTMGFIHEHMRQALVNLIDPAKAYPFFLETQGWSQQVVNQQVLTPIEESSLTGTAPPDPDSIMCYQIPGTITRNGEPIVGGVDIDATDYGFAAKLYPK